MRFQITDNIDTNQTTASLFKRAVKIAGLEFEPYNASATGQLAFTPPSKEEVADAAYQIAVTGEDPSSDPVIQQMLMSRLLAEQTGGLQYRHRVSISRAELEHYQAQAPALLEELSAVFTEAVETMQEAIAVIGHMTLEAAIGQTGNMAPRSAKAVAAAFAANNQAQGIIEALPYIVAAATGANVETAPGHTVLTYAKPSYGQFVEHRLNSSHNNHSRAHNVWDMLNDQIPVELATTQEELQERANQLERAAMNAKRDWRAEAAQHSEARAQAKAMGLV